MNLTIITECIRLLESYASSKADAGYIHELLCLARKVRDHNLSQLVVHIDIAHDKLHTRVEQPGSSRGS